jgi:dienelactone hydrolase
VAHLWIFHHVLGVTDGLRAFAARFEAAGHTVNLPDAFAGRTFSAMDEGVRYVDSSGGFAACTRRWVDAVGPMAEGTVVLGVSLGVGAAQALAQMQRGGVRDAIRGAVLVSACVPFETFSDRWPSEVPVQVHAMEHDPWFTGDGDAEAAAALVAHAPKGRFFTYPGSAHLWCDASLASFDATATDGLVAHVSNLLDVAG